jgi:general secretion pathway protein H
MPTLATGARRPRDRGFTLVEVMVTLLLLGLVTGVALSLPAGGANLSREAQALASRIKHAQREAMLTNRAVEIVVADANSHFRVRRAGRWENLADGPFGPRPWDAGVQAAMSDTGMHGVRFDPSGATDPAIIRLSLDAQVVEVTVDAHGQVTIHER